MSAKMPTAKVLLIEDEPIIAEELKSTLKEEGYSIIAVPVRAKDAIELAVKHPPDVILTNIKLAGKRSGVEAAAEIVEQLGKPVPVVFISGSSFEECKKLKAVPYRCIRKPFKTEEVLNAVKHLLSSDRLRR
jgi:CheY-like chemotaxis protein